MIPSCGNRTHVSRATIWCSTTELKMVYNSIYHLNITSYHLAGFEPATSDLEGRRSSNQAAGGI